MDRSSEQTGIYGTAAGIGALGFSERHRTVRGYAIRYLLRRYDGRQRNSADRYQFELLPKVVAYLQAFHPTDLAVDNHVSRSCMSLIDLLNDAQLDGSGWGFYYVSSALKDTSPSTLVTSFVILSVYHLALDGYLRGINQAIAWLSTETARGFKEMYPGELALVLLALRASQARGLVQAGALRNAHNWLLKQIRVNPTAWEEYLISYEAVTKYGQKLVANDEYFVLHSPLLILEYLLRHSSLRSMDLREFGYCLRVLANVESHGYYVSHFNNRAATRTNQRAYEFCLLLRDKLTESATTYALLRYVAGLKRVVSFRAVILIIVTFLVVLVVRSSQSDNQSANLAVDMAIAVLGGLAANTITGRL
jgi:hypothetical protein